MAGSTLQLPGRNHYEQLEAEYGQAARRADHFEQYAAGLQHQLLQVEKKAFAASEELQRALQDRDRQQSEVHRLQNFLQNVESQRVDLVRERDLLQQQLAEAAHRSDQQNQLLRDSVAEVAKLNAYIDTLEEAAELKAAKASSDCVISLVLAMTSAEARRNYEPAIKAFLSPLEQRFIMRHEILNPASRQPCKFIIWAVVAAGRLPDELPEFEEFRRASGEARLRSV
ncbi:hypothetical protein WJX74_000583 [Apatococcus lobatus]|uniref:Uncharacterized protein n=1 Tax=Apatococcus lobatus TaxID=904363 RepID=A0AAW1QM85_9CHLO